MRQYVEKLYKVQQNGNNYWNTKMSKSRRGSNYVYALITIICENANADDVRNKSMHNYMWKIIQISNSKE